MTRGRSVRRLCGAGSSPGRGSGGARWSRACSAGRRLRAPLFTAEERKEQSAAHSPARCGPARSLAQSLAVSASERAARGPVVRCGAVARRRAAGEVGSGSANGVGVGKEGEREVEDEGAGGTARKRRA